MQPNFESNASQTIFKSNYKIILIDICWWKIQYTDRKKVIWKKSGKIANTNFQCILPYKCWPRLEFQIFNKKCPISTGILKHVTGLVRLIEEMEWNASFIQMRRNPFLKLFVVTNSWKIHLLFQLVSIINPWPYDFQFV